jgi:hypothetical protein
MRIGQGSSFVRIHSIREALGWPREVFDRALEALAASYTIELHGGDPGSLSPAELADSFTDANGTQFITVSWRGGSAPPSSKDED